MGIMSCLGCGKDISKKARSCPHCGHTYGTALLYKMWIAKLVGMIIGIPLFLIIFSSILQCGSKAP